MLSYMRFWTLTCNNESVYPFVYPLKHVNDKGLATVKLQGLVLFGAPEEIRTPDPLVRSKELHGFT